VLRHQLAAPIAFGPERGTGSDRPIPATFGDLLCEARPSLSLLVLLKDFARAHTLQPNSPIPHEVATILYYAAIIAALVNSDQRISSLSDESLCKGIKAILDFDWIDDATRDLFAEGLRRLQRTEASG
jgi:hypothetical protein